MQYNVNSYRKNEVETNDPLKLVVMLFEGAINFCKQAKLRMQENKMADKGILISKVLAILGELQSSLDLDKGGEVAANMDRLYTYMSDRLMEANANNDSNRLDEVMAHMNTLLDAWKQAAVKQAQENKPQTAQENVVNIQQPKPAPDYSASSKADSEKVSGMPAIEIMG